MTCWGLDTVSAFTTWFLANAFAMAMARSAVSPSATDPLSTRVPAALDTRTLRAAGTACLIRDWMKS